MSRKHTGGQRFNNPATKPKLKATPPSPSSKKAARKRRKDKERYYQELANIARRDRVKKDPANYGL